MRIQPLLFILLCISTTVHAATQQQTHPKKVLTPEQQEYQQKSKQINAERKTLRADAKEVFDTEMAREKAPECPDAQTTVDIEICLGQESDITQANFQKYINAIRSMLGLKEPVFPGAQQTSSTPGQLSPDQFVPEFDQTEKTWESYRDAECTAAFHQFFGGSGGPPAQVECQLKMTRERMRDLNSVYNFH